MGDTIPFSPSCVISLTVQLQIVDVTEGLWYIHNMGMVHGDLKGVSSFAFCRLRAYSMRHF
jgi:hypothetical protein